MPSQLAFSDHFVQGEVIGDLRRMNQAKLTLFGPLPELAALQSGKAASGREASPVGRPDFKSGEGRKTARGGFDSCLLRQNRLQ